MAGVPYEIRVTVHDSLLSRERLIRLLDSLEERGTRKIMLQPCRGPNMLDPTLGQFSAWPVGRGCGTYPLGGRGRCAGRFASGLLLMSGTTGRCCIFRSVPKRGPVMSPRPLVPSSPVGMWLSLPSLRTAPLNAVACQQPDMMPPRWQPSSVHRLSCCIRKRRGIVRPPAMCSPFGTVCSGMLVPDIRANKRGL